MASATFQCRLLILTLMSKTITGAFPPFSTDYLGNRLSNINYRFQLLPTVNLIQTPQIFSSLFYFRDFIPIVYSDSPIIYYLQ
jgi:hypothetical protein